MGYIILVWSTTLLGNVCNLGCQEWAKNENATIKKHLRRLLSSLYFTVKIHHILSWRKILNYPAKWTKILSATVIIITYCEHEGC